MRTTLTLEGDAGRAALSGLLDLNVLIALAWPPHEHHARALAWFRQHAQAGWGSTVMTQSAFVRIVSQPAFAGQPMSIGEVGKALLQMTGHAAHRLQPLARDAERRRLIHLLA